MWGFGESTILLTNQVTGNSWKQTHFLSLSVVLNFFLIDVFPNMSSSVCVLCPCFIRSMCVCVFLGTFKLYSRIWNVIRAGDFRPLHFHEDLEEDVVVNPEDRDSVRDEVVQTEHERDNLWPTGLSFQYSTGLVV